MTSSTQLPEKSGGEAQDIMKSSLKSNSSCPSERDINVLLLGATGVGKTTFINAFANYIVNDTLQQAETRQNTSESYYLRSLLFNPDYV